MQTTVTEVQRKVEHTYTLTLTYLTGSWAAWASALPKLLMDGIQCRPLGASLHTKQQRCDERASAGHTGEGKTSAEGGGPIGKLCPKFEKSIFLTL